MAEIKDKDEKRHIFSGVRWIPSFPCWPARLKSALPGAEINREQEE